ATAATHTGSLGPVPASSTVPAPMLATRGEHVPRGADWVHEVKWDGIRALVETSATQVRVWTRSGRDISVAFPELAAMKGRSLVLDGEIVSLRDGVPTLMALADRIHVTDSRKAATLAASNPAVFLIFDVLSVDGEPLLAAPWQQRRDVLESLELGDVAWQVPSTYDDGEVLLEAARAQGLEGDRVEEAVLDLSARSALRRLAEVPDSAHGLICGGRISV
ncbi:MAG: hypothetical protein V9E81_03405, partial [Marmoricola sp.]